MWFDDFWWKKRLLPIGESAYWKVGPLHLRVKRYPTEWRVHWLPGEDLSDREFTHQLPAENHFAGGVLSRFAVSEGTSSLTLEPCLADRPVVTRPTSPVWILGDDSVTFFVSTPLWVRIRVGEKERILTEIPILRPSDTWFGPTSMDGELCFASRTKLLTRESELERWPFRAISAISIQNRIDESLLLERLKLPMPFLSLYRGSDGICFTDRIVFRRERHEDYAHLHIVDRSEASDTDVLRVHSPRQVYRMQALSRAFNSFFER